MDNLPANLEKLRKERQKLLEANPDPDEELHHNVICSTCGLNIWLHGTEDAVKRYIECHNYWCGSSDE